MQYKDIYPFGEKKKILKQHLPTPTLVGVDLDKGAELKGGLFPDTARRGQRLQRKGE